VVSGTPWPYFTHGKDPVPIVQEAGWAPGPVWMGGKSCPTGIRSPDRPAHSQSLYRLSYRAHSVCIVGPLITEHVTNVSISKAERNVCCCQFMRRCKVVHCYLKHFFQNVIEVLWISVSTWNTRHGAQSASEELSRKIYETSKIQKGRRGMYRAILATMGY
jgi:predicted CoA-binding protein